MKKIFCALFGHTHIYNVFIGYHYCARCGELMGDSLAGVFFDSLCVAVDHNCQTCFDNYAKLSWKDKFLVKYPFEKDENGLVRVITEEEREIKMDEMMENMKKERKRILKKHEQS